MKEIKFRAWDADLKQMMPEVDLSAPRETYKWLGLADLPIMQFTGLKDKNGKEIYEGDIIQFTEIDEDSAFSAEETNIVEVRWIDEISQWRAVFKSGRRTELHFVVQLPTVVSCEVIGNIYENPELLQTTLSPER